ncbi:MAG: endonuclease/exonuclease/phosphatase family protein [Bacteroidales bacterium]|nr:endonuclease/exonuclease/phosphatase family protein [Bacteroidales bacterium]
MSSKRFGIFKWIGKALLMLASVTALGALFLSLLAKVIPPSLSTMIAYCGLLFPYIVIANFILLIIWIPVDYRWSIVFALMLILNVNNIDRHFQLRAMEKPETCANCLKIMSFNVHDFNIYAETYPQDAKRIIAFLKKEKPDILCLQEYCYDKKNKRGLDVTQEILKALGLPDSPRNFQLNLPSENRLGYQFGLAVFSAYRIVDCGVVEMSDSSSNKSMYVDIRYNGDTVRVYNVHLSSFHINQNDYADGEAILHNDNEDGQLNEKMVKLYKKIGLAFEQRQEQARSVRAHIDTCASPVIICGDFNDTPESYSYFKIAHGFKDSFRSSGKGTGVTYKGGVFPSYRIDYIIHSKFYNDFGHTICTDMDVSDHYPIYSYVSLLNK